ncbi:MAG: CidA/LrgA family protein [Geminicoccaceae bacterium]
MLGFITTLLVCQLIGETVVVATHLPVPGPVIGMLLLFAGLMIRGGVPQQLDAVTGFLLQHLSLLFVPAGVGVLAHVDLLSRDWWPIGVTVVISTLATIVLTAWLVQLCNRWRGRADAVAGEGAEHG